MLFPFFCTLSQTFGIFVTNEDFDESLLTSPLREKLVKDDASEKRFMLSIYQQQKEQLMKQGLL